MPAIWLELLVLEDLVLLVGLLGGCWLWVPFSLDGVP